MSEHIDNCNEDGHCNEKDRNILCLLLGKKACINSRLGKLFWYLGVVFFVTLVFLILLCSNRHAGNRFVNLHCNIGLQIVIFVILVIAIDYLMRKWRKQNPISADDDE